LSSNPSAVKKKKKKKLLIETQLIGLKRTEGGIGRETGREGEKQGEMEREGEGREGETEEEKEGKGNEKNGKTCPRTEEVRAGVCSPQAKLPN
jgi:hypothetical protein